MKHLPYSDPTGDKAAARVDRAEREYRNQAALVVLDALADPKVSDKDAAYLLRAISPELAKTAT